MEEQKKKLNIKDILIVISVTLNIGLIIWFAVSSSKPKNDQRQQRGEQYPKQLTIDVKEFAKDSYFLGNYDAKVTVVLFNSFTCGFCKRAKEFTLQLIKKYPKDLKVVYKHFNRGGDDYNPDLQPANAVECAGDQNKFWGMFDMIFEKGVQGDYVAYARDLGMNIAEFKKCQAKMTHKDKTVNDTLEAVRIGIRGTPSFLINNKLVVGFRPDMVESTIQKELK